MNLIEQLGGYERAKYLKENALMIGSKREKLTSTLLEYRRENNIFEVGDLITLNKFSSDFSRSHNGVYEILRFENDLETLVLLSKGIRSSTQHIKHATPEEIKAGHRL